MKNGEQRTFAVGGCTNTVSQKFRGKVNISYTAESGLSKKKVGSIIDRVESGCAICACANTDTSCGGYPICRNCVSDNGFCQGNPAQCVCAGTSQSCGAFPTCNVCGTNKQCQSNSCIWNLNGVWGANFIYGYKRTNFIQNGNNVHDSLIDPMPGFPVGSETINIVITGNTFSGIAHSTIGDKVYQGTIENSGTTLNGIFDPGGFNADFDYNKE